MLNKNRKGKELNMFWNKIVSFFKVDMPHYEVIADTDSHKIIVMIPSEAADEVTNKQWEKIWPKWAKDNNFTMSSTREGVINIKGNFTNLWQINGVAIMWSKNSEV